ncbi:MAG: nucleotidyltransferase family protein, partial [Rhodobacteraceae bacterium]|nr:nucleotidyltransferase family protein [Paracoccaceae bacterium]
LYLVWNAMSADERLFGLPYPGRWCDVGHPEGIRLAEEMLAADV